MKKLIARGSGCVCPLRAQNPDSMNCSRTAHTILSGLGKKVASLTALTLAEELVQ